VILQAPPVLSIVGRSKTGKTTLIEGLLPILRRQGLKVATIKHHHGDFPMDVPGKDTDRHKKAGAVLTIIASPTRIGLVRDLDRELDLHEIVRSYAGHVDLVIAEGYKKAPVPKIEVLSPLAKEGAACADDPGLLALVTDMEGQYRVPVFSPGEPERIVQFIIDRIISRRVS
jgi:molybdopterin-guanine dinucleotide biosynthesis protein B